MDKNLSFAAQAYIDKASVGTPFGTKFNSTDPFAIYKESTPYLYLTKDSGIEPLDGGVVDIPFNQNLDPLYPVSMMTFWIKPDFQNFDDGSLLDISVFGVNQISLSFNADVPDSDSKTFSMTSANENLLEYVLINKNNSQPTTPNAPITLENNQWAFVGIELPVPVYANNTEGKTTIHAGAVYQNINLTRVSTFGLASAAVLMYWEDIEDQTWAYWSTAVPTYRDLITSEQYFT